jgi:hypothetical protein
MSKKWPGGIITPTPATPTGPYENGTAPGIWTLSQQAYWQKQGLWPIAGNALPPPRAYVFGGLNGAGTTFSTISYVVVTTTGNTSSFGNLGTAQYNGGAVSSITRGVLVGGAQQPTVMQYITLDTSGTATNFGTLSPGSAYYGGASNGVRGVMAANAIYYITIATTGNATSFGNLTESREGSSTVNSPTRSIFLGGEAGGSPKVNTIDYVTTATTGNATDFGDLSQVSAFQQGGCSSSTRGVVHLGTNSVITSALGYITMATTGNSTSFGNLTNSTVWTSQASSTTRGLTFAGSLNNGGSNVNVIDYITIATTGNAIDFGDMSAALERTAALSNCHGGLS